MTTTTLRTAVDAYVDQDQPGQNFGRDVKKLSIRGNSGTRRRALVYFPRPFTLGASVTEATLRATLKTALAGGPHIFTVKRIDEKTWKEGKVTWNNQPDVTATNLATASVTAGIIGQVIEWDVTAMMNDVSSGGAFYGFQISVDTNGTKDLHSAEATVADVHPELEVEWSLAPNAPTLLGLINGKVTSLEFPVLPWLYSDNSGDTQQGFSRVEITTTDDEDFAAVEYDSGWVANAEGQWDLAATAYTGVPVGESRIWRATVRNTAGLESEPSEAGLFSRVDKGVLAITSPASDDDDVEETTPPIIHTFGGTQVATEYFLYAGDESADTWTEIHHREYTATDETSYTLPSGLISDEVTDYKVVVRAWDDQDRVDLPADRPYEEAVRIFQFAMTSPVSAALAFEATPEFVATALTWLRPTSPDYFALLVDGHIVEDRIDPEDVLVGTSFRGQVVSQENGSGAENLVFRYDGEDIVEVPWDIAGVDLASGLDAAHLLAIFPDHPELADPTVTGPAGGPWLVVFPGEPEFLLEVVPGSTPGDIDPDVSAMESFETTWWRAIPGRAYTYGLQAVVSDGGVKKHSATVEDSATTRPSGIWLVAPDEGLWCVLGDKVDANLGIGETGETFNLLRRQDPVRLTDTIRGLEGSVGGLMVNAWGRTATQHHEDWEAIKALNNRSEIRLIVGSYNFAITLAEATKDFQESTPEKAWNVEFNLTQKGDFRITPVGLD